MTSEHKKWTKKFDGNLKILHKVKNPLRHYVQKVLPIIDLSQYPNRPSTSANLSIGDPTNCPQYRTNPQNLQVLIKNVGKIDGYTKFVGCDEARESVAKKFACQNYHISKDNVILTAGGSLAMWATILLLADQGDNFLVPSPGFPLCSVIANTIGIEVKNYHLNPLDNWKVDLVEMEQLIDERTRFILVNDPSNPLGACWSAEHKKQIIEIARKKKIPILADEIYEGMTYGEPMKCFAELATEDVTIFKCSGFTKRWLVPGWRFGWVIVYAKEETFKCYYRYLKNIFNIILMPHTVIQASAKQIIENKRNDEYIVQKMQEMSKNQRLLEQGLKQESYCSVGHALGALYETVLMRMQMFDKKQFENVVQFCKKIFAEENIMIFPSTFFGSETTFVRLCICTSKSNVEEFLVRFKRFCRKYLLK